MIITFRKRIQRFSYHHVHRLIYPIGLKHFNSVSKSHLLLTSYGRSSSTSTMAVELDDQGQLVTIASPLDTINPVKRLEDEPTIKTTAFYNPYDIVEESLAVMSANLKLGEPYKAEMMFQKLWRANFGNFRNKVNIQTLNALIEGYLLINDLQNSSDNRKLSQRRDVEKALNLYSNLSKYTLSPNLDTFSILIYHFSRNSEIEPIAKLFQEMKAFGLNPKNLSEHYLFDNPQDLLQLKTLFKQLNLNVDFDEPIPDEDLMLSALEDTSIHSNFSNRPLYHENQDKLSPTSTQALQNVFYGQQTRETPIMEDESSKSIGVKMLKKTLRKVGSFLEENQEKIRIQEILEEESNKLALMEHDEQYENIPDYLKQMTGVSRSFLREWHRELVPVLRREMKLLHRKKKSTQSIKEFEEFMHLPFFNMLRPEQLSVITILEFLRAPFRANSDSLSGFFGETKAVAMFTRIGMAVEQEANAQSIALKKTKSKVASDPVYHLHASGKLKNPKTRMAALQIARKKLAKDQSWSPKWPETVLVRIGSVLATWLISVAKIKVKIADEESSLSSFKFVEIPAFEHVMVSEADGKKCGTIKFNENLLKELLKVDISVPPRYLPMIVPPRPWMNWKTGGYLTEHVTANMVRTGKHTEHEKYLDAADEKGHLSSIYHALDCLGLTAWRINKNVLSIATKCWNDGGSWPCIEPSNSLPIILKPKEADHDPSVKRQYRRKLLQREKEEKARYSQRCDAHYKILIADSFKDVPIYFPHYIDFRGRAYPLPVHLNHVGNDLCRGLMLFEKAKPLGEKGLSWLKVQLASLYGVDKVSFTEREGFVDENIHNIMDSVDRPLEGSRWWLKADNPWQCLATCFELTAALRSPNPASFLSRLPIHMDGTCNGLQHYAALGGDVMGAKMVNLIPSERPADVYTGVSQAVSKLVDKDAQDGHPIAQKVKGLISRKVIKQTVMTNTYGVTRIGARMQVQARLKDIKEQHGMDDTEMFKAATYIVDKIFCSLGEMFEGARSLQLWLNAAARTVASSIPESSLSEFEMKQACWLRDRGLLPDNLSLENEQSLVSSLENEVGHSSNDLDFQDDEEQGISFRSSSTSELAEAAESDIISETTGSESLANTKPPEILSSDIENKSSHSDASDKEDVTQEEKKDPMKMASVIWTTPLGLPVVQPYWNFKSRIVKTMLQDVTLHDTKTPCPVDTQKQTTAFPPNFVHSLDASHMMLSAIACNSAGLEFAAVHDSYWTHASDVDQMNYILRDAFVRLHKQDLMSRLRSELLSRYKSHKIPVKIELKGENLQAFRQFLENNKKKNTDSISSRAISKYQPTLTLKNSKVNSTKKVVQTWIDFNLPPLPKKGLFNVEIVKDSKYFFH